MKKGYYGEYTGNARHSRKQEMIHDRELIYDAKSDIHSEDKKYRDSGSDSDKRDMIHERELIHDTKTQLHHADQDYKSDGPHYQPGEIYVKDEGTEKMDAEMKHLDGMVGAGLSIINALDKEKEEEEEEGVRYDPDGTGKGYGTRYSKAIKSGGPQYAPNTGQGMLESWGYEASATNIDARKSKAN